MAKEDEPNGKTVDKSNTSDLDSTLNNQVFDDKYKLQIDAIAQVTGLHRNFKKDTKDRKSSPFYFKKKMETLNQIQQSFMDRHQSMVQLSEDRSHEYFVDSTYSEFDDLILDYMIELTSQHDELIKSLGGENHSACSKVATYVQEQQHHRLSDFSLRLPQINLPTFSGNYIDWPEFYDSFDRLIHMNMQLAPVEKFRHLKNALPTNFDTDIIGLPLTENNYSIAWKRLIERCNNKRVLFSNYLSKITMFSSLVEEQATEIRKMKQVANSCYTGLIQLGLEGHDFGKIIVYLLASKLPKVTHQQWELHLGTASTIPNFENFINFLDNRFRMLESWELLACHSARDVNPKTSKTFQSKSFRANHTQIKPNYSKPKKFKAKSNKSTSIQCSLCKEPHSIHSCPKFLGQDCFARKDTAIRLKLCLNCLFDVHITIDCKSRKNCQTCGKRHHTLLHFPNTTRHNNVDVEKDCTTSVNHTEIIQSNNISFKDIPRPLEVLLPTAIVLVRLNDGTKKPLRALLDQGSTGALISKHAVDSLKLSQYKFNSAITLPAGQKSTGDCITSLTIMSKFDRDFEITIVACIVKKPTENLPINSIKNLKFSHFENIELADPEYMHSRTIDILLGSDVYAQVLYGDVIRGQINEPIAQKTKFGWIVSGSIFRVDTPFGSNTIECNHVAIDMNNIFQRFYESEGIPKALESSSEDTWCKNFFRDTHIRQPNGKYLVRLPLKSCYDSNINIGKSRHIALRRFLSLERKLENNPHIKQQYHDAIHEYFALNQIEECTSREIDCVKFDPINNRPSQTCSYLPHHAVIKPSRLTTKCRVVFDASAKTSNGRSLNDILCKGPKILNDLTSILTNWRFHKYVFTADIEKMYRCIDVFNEDAQYQRILWRFNPNDDIKEYFLNTVTFGTRSAPFVAIETTHQLADDESDNYPLAQHIIKNEMYVDDINSGSNTVDSAIVIIDQVRKALQSGGFELRKWASNSPELLKNIPIEHQCMDPNKLWDEDDHIKTLGLCWSPKRDTFHYKVQLDETVIKFTKRSVASKIARIYDPLGLINPIIVTAKIFLSKLWQLKIDWDDEIPEDLRSEWKTFLTNLKEVANIHIPRWIKFSETYQRIELHIFCDGSNHAYAANVFIRIQMCDNNFHTNLLSTKSTTVPIELEKNTPRIELLAASLAIKLMNWAKVSLRVKIDQTFFWSDSSVVLCWIRGDIEKWPVFVRNRIKMIHENSKIEDWYHIDTHLNPADIASRGATPRQLRKCELYWEGPSFLKLPQSQWPKQPDFKGSIETQCPKQSYLSTTELHMEIQTNNSVISNNEFDQILDKYSSFQKLCHTIGWVIRWKNIIKNPSIKSSQYLTIDELRKAHDCIIRLLQNKHFFNEIKILKKGEHLSNSHPLANLAPFLDAKGIMRVLGRLKNSSLSYDKRHPIILPKKCQVTTSIIDDVHKFTMHGRLNITFTSIRNKYWIVNASSVIKNRLKKCITCFTLHPKVDHQQMGNLPACRFLSFSPFTIVGIDYTGPFSLKASRFRGNTSYKGYVILFICLNTKAIHLDVTSGMSIDDFLAAFQRFISRRGTPKEIHSDNGPNFVGSNNKIQKEFRNYKSAIDSIMPQFIDRQIEWKFIPPYSPNFGGLWESNIKSMKHHLKSSVTSSSFTFEEFTTILSRIESALNSRPLTTIVSDTNDVEILTPGHFLTGKSLLIPPEPIIEDISPTKRYLIMQRAYQQFWRNWSNEWLTQLQKRNKWKSPQDNLKVGDIVLIKEDNLVSNKWALGKIENVRTGNDGLVRVVSLKTGSSTTDRAISKICRLPLDVETKTTEIQKEQ